MRKIEIDGKKYEFSPSKYKNERKKHSDFLKAQGVIGGVTQVDQILAERLNLSYESIRNYSKGCSGPEEDGLRQIADIFGCDILDMLELVERNDCVKTKNYFLSPI